VIAAIAIGLPDAAFLGGLYGYMAVVRRFAVVGNAWRPDLDPAHILIGAIVGIAAALYVAAIMRRGFRPAAAKKRALPTVTEPASSRWLLKHDRIAARRVSAC
jgi:urea transporter